MDDVYEYVDARVEPLLNEWIAEMTSNSFPRYGVSHLGISIGEIFLNARCNEETIVEWLEIEAIGSAFWEFDTKKTASVYSAPFESIH